MIPSEPSYKRRMTNRVVGVIAIVLFGFAVFKLVAPPPAPPAIKAMDDRVAVMDAKLQNIDHTIALYDERLTKLEKFQQDADAALHAKQVQINPVVNAGDAAAPTPAVVATGDEAKRIEALEKEIATLKTATPMQDGEHIAHSIKLLSAFHRLSDRVLAGKAYADELASFENLVGDAATLNKPLSDLSAYAEAGVPTQTELLASFDNAVDQLNVTQAVPPAEAGVWDRFVFNITHLIRVRRNDAGATGKDIDSIISRASAHMDKDEIEAAIAEINSLPENARADFTAWLEEAQISVNAPLLIDKVEEQVMQQVFMSGAKEGNAPVVDKGLNVQ